jgi:hypothetical protein
MAIAKPILRIIIFTALIAVITSWLIDVINSSMMLNLNTLAAGRGGGGCRTPFYDSLGYAHGPDETPYIGPAPLYVLGDSVTGQIIPGCKYIKFIDPSVVINKGRSLYPVHLSVSVPSKWFRVGESTILTATVSVDNQFSAPSDTMEQNMFWTADKEGEITFSIEAPNFDTGPSNGTSQKSTLAIGKPAQKQWIIAPKERSTGRQFIGIYIQDYGTGLVPSGLDLFAYIEIEIRPTIGVNPIVATWVTGIGAFILWILSIIKSIQDIIEKRKQPNKVSTGQSYH